MVYGVYGVGVKPNMGHDAQYIQRSPLATYFRFKIIFSYPLSFPDLQKPVSRKVSPIKFCVDKRGLRCSETFDSYSGGTPLCPQKLALTSPTSGGRSVGIVRSWTKATELVSSSESAPKRLS
jgi:hypothetical protein